MERTQLRSARDYFEEVLKPTCDRFFAEPSSFQNVYAMTTSLFHFNEWMWFYKSAELRAKYAVENASKFWHEVVEKQVVDAGLIRDLTNVSKHVKIGDKRTPPSTQMHHSANTSIVDSGYGEGGYGVGRFGGGDVKLAEGSREVSLDNVAASLFAFWEGLINEIDPKVAVILATGTAPSSNS